MNYCELSLGLYTVVKATSWQRSVALKSWNTQLFPTVNAEKDVHAFLQIIVTL